MGTTWVPSYVDSFGMGIRHLRILRPYLEYQMTRSRGPTPKDYQRVQQAVIRLGYCQDYGLPKPYSSRLLISRTVAVNRVVWRPYYGSGTVQRRKRERKNEKRKRKESRREDQKKKKPYRRRGSLTVVLLLFVGRVKDYLPREEKCHKDRILIV